MELARGDFSYVTDSQTENNRLKKLLIPPKLLIPLSLHLPRPLDPDRKEHLIDGLTSLFNTRVVDFTYRSKDLWLRTLLSISHLCVKPMEQEDKKQESSKMETNEIRAVIKISL
ncbi:hypothetical protein LAZ67_11001190 [Cordylochernes scorpioides]|uniref:Uncharacterized protein n=1 Tax=Cordylochernes scorpioides TaxID=51811 RepID=A0ABY6KZ05_9ARAC|nr:hypothetical protein LAZ67_11001190 [Cordylochernes scorpioides]